MPGGFKGGPGYGQQVDQWQRSRVGPVAVATGAAAIIGAAFSEGQIVNLHVCNANAAARTVTTYLLPAGASVAAGYIFDLRSVAATSAVDLVPAFAPIKVAKGDRLFMLASGADVTVTVSLEVEK